MNKTIAKLFYKNSAVKVHHVGENKRISTYYGVPVNGVLTIKEINKSFIVNPEKVVFDKKRFPTLITNYKEPYLIDSLDTHCIIDEKGEPYTSDKLNVAISSKIGRDIFLSNGLGDINLGVVLALITLALVGVVAYMVYQQNNDFMEQINQLKEIIGAMGGTA